MNFSGPKLLVFVGILLIFLGSIWYLGSKFLPLGKLPGDIVIEKENFKFYFPLITCLLISVILTLIAYLFRSR